VWRACFKGKRDKNIITIIIDVSTKQHVRVDKQEYVQTSFLDLMGLIAINLFAIVG
jgi:hypothetical protein